MNECFKKGKGFLKSRRHPASLGAAICPKGSRQIKPEDLIPVVKVARKMEKRETEASEATAVWTVRRMRGDGMHNTTTEYRFHIMIHTYNFCIIIVLIF